MLDGDKNPRRLPNNFCILPGDGESLEKMFFHFLNDLSNTASFWNQAIGGYTKQVYFENYVNREPRDRDEFEQWFNGQERYWGKGCQKLFKRWTKDNLAPINIFENLAYGQIQNTLPGHDAEQYHPHPRTVPQLHNRISRRQRRSQTWVDFDLLRQELSDALVAGPQERYRLDWPDKRQALLTANTLIAKTLRPCREESVDFDTTKNLYIEGDNLDALKFLQKSYLGKVKMIYIDPPYNTGNDSIYKDDFAENTDEYLVRPNQKDEEGKRLFPNTGSNGRFHSDWLRMMYGRLKLERTLFRDDGIILTSIDDNEVENSKKIGNDVFVDNNFIDYFYI